MRVVNGKRRAGFFQKLTASCVSWSRAKQYGIPSNGMSSINQPTPGANTSTSIRPSISKKIPRNLAARTAAVKVVRLARGLSGLEESQNIRQNKEKIASLPQVPHFLDCVADIDRQGVTSVESPAPSVSNHEHQYLFHRNSDERTDSIGTEPYHHISCAGPVTENNKNGDNDIE